MYRIYKINSSPVVDFAAEELKKYLRMMMPRCGEIVIERKPDATCGFRLGLMQDFSLDTSEAKDTYLDDILHIDTDQNGGIISGSNPRSVLLAVYKYLTLNGCRWLFPGIDGEFIPIKDIVPTTYHKMADNRYRGQCNEGAEYQPDMIEAIDFMPKIGMNVFMIEFFNPRFYYDCYYSHKYNEANREPEPVSADIILQWKRQCESEMAKRGLQLHDVGHGWAAESFGIDTTNSWVSRGNDVLPEEARQYMALVEGKRGLYKGVGLNTNFCMSQEVARKIVVDNIVDYAEKSSNVDYLSVVLADGDKNYCECENCKKMMPSDWYVTILNELDEALTAKGLKTRITFAQYHDTSWAPEQTVLKNPDRFTMNVCAISRDYTESVSENIDVSSIEFTPFAYNSGVYPSRVDEYLAYADKWKKLCHIPTIAYEYHFWRPYFRDLGILDSAKIIYKDVIGYRANGCGGMIEDGSQRSFFPNGLLFYVYASTLFDCSQKFEDIVEDYFSHAYGEDFREVYSFLERMGGVDQHKFLNGKLSASSEMGDFYNPNMAEVFRNKAMIADEFISFVNDHKNMPYRAQTVSYRMLARYLEYCKGIARPLALKALGANAESRAEYFEFADRFGKYELEMERWYDHFLEVDSLKDIFKRA